MADVPETLQAALSGRRLHDLPLPGLREPLRFSMCGDSGMEYRRLAWYAGAEFKAGSGAVRRAGERLAVGTQQPPVGEDRTLERRSGRLRIHRRAFPRDTGRDVETPSYSREIL